MKKLISLMLVALLLCGVIPTFAEETPTHVLKGLAVRGSKAQNDAEGTGVDVANWLKGIGLAQ